MTTERIALIGAGAAGSAIILALHQAGYPIIGVASRRLDSAKQCAERVECPLATTDAAKVSVNADIIFIATPDDQITTACQAIADQGVIRPGQLFIHLSGARTSDALAAAQRKGAETLSLHPIQALADPVKGASLLKNTYFCLEGTAAAVTKAMPLINSLSGKTLVIPATKKAQYHAALCMASNYLITLESVAVSLLEQIGVDRMAGMQALLPLIQGSVENLAHSGLPNALTGPISRGDAETIAHHIDSLRDIPQEYQSLYRILGKETIQLALDKGGLSAEAAEQIKVLLTPLPPDECLIT
ncbi:Rossmann-like and DUF2520 domain-containing protein [Sedimenticola selenatireducens]|uniref:DUF2520 domain-containing protein n=1 Tax=Sedimenticola selenatireducens TaxID=191960 RepID=A0A557SMM4_9GAMM|nr:Rossmann-like and DUF2520 domain-containing protein [Sedimenticola selenatireducens]TVO78669.1 DUF2520 domain-containing protein [Sedimenticola selenatireducens]TVT62031.1 MAG: DUF2520 domain-containing protein [Sedimenticola selenatireducens]